jgi:hypothetical protein
MVAEGATLHSVAQALNREGLQPPELSGSGLWSVTFVRGVIKDDIYKAHSFQELEALVAPEVAARLDQSLSYGVWWFNRKRTVRQQVAEDGPEGRVYRNRFKVIKRASSEWIAVPDPGIPREVVDGARIAIRDNRSSLNSKRRFFELSGGLMRCRGCGRRMASLPP